MTTSDLSTKQRLQLLQEGLQAARAQLGIQRGVQVVEGHGCGCCSPGLPKDLPADAWVVHLGCSKQVPEQINPEALRAATGEPEHQPDPDQLASFEALLAVARAESKNRPHTGNAPIHQADLPIPSTNPAS